MFAKIAFCLCLYSIYLCSTNCLEASNGHENAVKSDLGPENTNVTNAIEPTKLEVPSTEAARKKRDVSEGAHRYWYGKHRSNLLPPRPRPRRRQYKRAKPTRQLVPAGPGWMRVKSRRRPIPIKVSRRRTATNARRRSDGSAEAKRVVLKDKNGRNMLPPPRPRPGVADTEDYDEKRNKGKGDGWTPSDYHKGPPGKGGMNKNKSYHRPLAIPIPTEGWTGPGSPYLQDYDENGNYQDADGDYNNYGTKPPAKKPGFGRPLPRPEHRPLEIQKPYRIKPMPRPPPRHPYPPRQPNKPRQWYANAASSDSEADDTYSYQTPAYDDDDDEYESGQYNYDSSW